jgi:hypothetical protein
MRQVLPLRLDSFARRLTASLLAAAAAASLGACSRESSRTKPTATTETTASEHARPGAQTNPPSPASYVVTVDGESAGFALDAFGGNLKGIVQVHGEVDRHTKKHLRSSSYEPIVLSMAADLPDAMSAWVQDSWTHPGEAAHDGTIGAADFEGHIRESLDFEDADLTQVTFPSFDVSERNEGQLALEIAPGRTVRGDGSGITLPRPRRRRAWVPSNFALELDGLDTSHVMRIESFTVRLPTDGRTPVDFPNLVVTLPRAYASTWTAWADSFIGANRPSSAAEISGELRLLGPDLRTVIATIRLDHVGIVRVSQTPASSRPEGAIATVTAELYVEGMQYVVTPAP